MTENEYFTSHFLSNAQENQFFYRSVSTARLAHDFQAYPKTEMSRNKATPNKEIFFIDEIKRNNAT